MKRLFQAVLLWAYCVWLVVGQRLCHSLTEFLISSVVLAVNYLFWAWAFEKVFR